LDLFSRQVVGWPMSNRTTKKLVLDSLLMALWRRRPGTGLLFHSDRGSQYSSNDFQKMRKSHAMVSSMRRNGDLLGLRSLPLGIIVLPRASLEV
jgi:putative transposase